MGHLSTLLPCLGLILMFPSQTATSGDCYNRRLNNKAKACFPRSENVAFGKAVEASNTCGETSESEYCSVKARSYGGIDCKLCNATDEGNCHPASFMTDGSRWTWWQSDTMMEGVGFPTPVNITLNLRGAYSITAVTLRFQSLQPESFAIFKRNGDDSHWMPYQFYSGSCQSTYGVRATNSRFRLHGTKALCLADSGFSLGGGSVSFSALEGRRGMHDYENNESLQEWLTVTGIRIMLTRMNTFGDEVFGDPNVLKSYYYAISELEVLARCQCNGHANQCRRLTDENEEDRVECQCQHRTTGPSCGQCLPFYNDRPWHHATTQDAHECQECHCSGLSDQCVFDQELFDVTGHGGRCINCRDGASGAHCELCEENFYRSTNGCTPCQCDSIGSSSLKCDQNGQCPCKQGVDGLRCDRCADNHYGFGPTGCNACQCSSAGSHATHCDQITGGCDFKENVEGHHCDSCKPGYFDLSAEDAFGCMACFCNGHCTECVAASGYYVLNVTSKFHSGQQGWAATYLDTNDEIETTYNAMSGNVSVAAHSNELIYFHAPSRYLGNQRFAYNQFLTFDLSIGQPTGDPSSMDIVLEGAGRRVTIEINGQSNPLPGLPSRPYAFRLHENPLYQWHPTLTAREYIAMLSNLTALKIRASYNPEGIGFIDNVQLMSAVRDFGDEPATRIESCSCPVGYAGQFCESCDQGYTRDPPMGGPSARCVPCQCNGRSHQCDADSGRCACGGNSEGFSCEHCAHGFYGNANLGNSTDCLPCPCSDGIPCTQIANGDVKCIDNVEVQKLKESVQMLEEKFERMLGQLQQDKLAMENRMKSLEDMVNIVRSIFPSRLTSSNE